LFFFFAQIENKSIKIHDTKIVSVFCFRRVTGFFLYAVKINTLHLINKIVATDYKQYY